MIGLRIAPLAGAAAQPWRNGGGVTRELLAWPAQAEDWTLRVSVARIDRDGPFSRFDGIERWFAVVQGAGVSLRFAQHTNELTPASAPLCFDGAQAPGCALRAGATVDLNLMLRRQAGHGAMQRAQPNAVWHSPAGWRALYTSGPARLSVDGSHGAELAAAALVWHPYAVDQRWSFRPSSADTLGWWLSFQPHGPLQ